MSSTTRNEKLILAYLEKQTPKTIAEIASELSFDEKEAQTLVNSLVNEGAIIQTEKKPARYGVKSVGTPPQHVSYGDIEKDIAETKEKEKQGGNRSKRKTVYEEDILVYIFDHGPLTIDQIAKAFSISTVTARKKVDILEKEGVADISKTKNGALLVSINHGISVPKYAFDEQGNPSYPLDAISDPYAAWNHFKDSGKMQAWLDKKKEERSLQNKKSKSTSPQKGQSTTNHLASMDAESVELVYHGHDVKPCFKVKTVADAFISVIDSISSLKLDSISMLGIFAAWGRGKSYLFDIVKKEIVNRPKEAIRYDIIEFNAWKYQSVPAIWASLFETIYHSKSWWFRLWYMIKQNAWPVIRDLLLFVSVPFVIWLLTFVPDLSAWAEKYRHLPLWSLIVSIAAFLVKLFAKEQKGIQEIIRKLFRGISFAEHLGVQAEIERNLVRYLKQWIHDSKTKSKKVILYVEDVDRCDSRKMIDIIESLRTVLEQPDIRKRLVVVLSIDAEKLWRAIELKYKELYEKEKLYESIVNHFDKLFTASITLSELESDEEIEFLKALEQPSNDDTPNFSVQEVVDKPGEIGPDGKSITKDVAPSTQAIQKAIPKVTKQEMVRPDDYRDVLRLISDSIQSLGLQHLTPRQLSCVYFRSLIAVNLIASSTERQRIDRSLTDQIIVRSYLHNRTELMKETPYESVLKMVIPYPVQEKTSNN